MGLNYRITEFNKCVKEINGESVVSLSAVSNQLTESKELYGSRQDKVDYAMMRKNLEDLHKQAGNDSKKKEFADFFENVLVGAFCRYRTSKKKAWGKWHNVALLLATACVPLISTCLVAWLESGEGYLAGVSTIAISAVLTLGVLSVAYIEWSKKKNDEETWVRHSVCYGRLNLLLQRYMFSEDKEQAYPLFVESTFAILDQNLDQFALNLSTNGLAERQGLKSEKDK